MRSIEGKSIIVTGAANGIGEAAAILFAENGARVTAADINDRGAEVVEKIRAAGGTAQFIRTDVAREEDVKAMIAAAMAAYGRIDGAFNNGGVPNVGKKLHEVDFSEWQRCHAINLAGVFLCMKYEIAEMLKTGGGAIVNTASVAGLVNVPLCAEYTASKHGVSGITKAAASDYGHDNIRVNAIAPGAVRTAMFAKSCEDNPNLEEYCAQVHPIGRFGEPIEQAEAAMWLLSDSASFVTGIVMPVDGGYTAV